MAREKLHRRLAGFFESCQRAGCGNELAQVKQRFFFLSFAFRKTPSCGFGGCFSEARRGAAHEEQIPSWRGNAPGRPRCQGRVVSRSSERTERTLTGETGGPGAGFQQEGQDGGLLSSRLRREDLMAYCLPEEGLEVVQQG